MNSFILLDGALLNGHADLSALINSGAAVAAYADLGEEAALAGPVVCDSPSITAPEKFTDRMQERAWRYGYAHINTPASMPHLMEHLASIQYIHTRDGQKFFLRYADARALHNVWHVLTAGQQQSLMGPIALWTMHDAHRQIQLTAPDTTRSTQLPASLVLNEAATEKLTDLSWGWNLLQAAQEAESSVINRGTDAQLLDWAAQASALVAQQGGTRFSIEVALVVAFITSLGTAGRDTSFQNVALSAMQMNQYEPIYDWCDKFDSTGTPA